MGAAIRACPEQLLRPVDVGHDCRRRFMPDYRYVLEKDTARESNRTNRRPAVTPSLSNQRDSCGLSAKAEQSGKPRKQDVMSSLMVARLRER